MGYLVKDFVFTRISFQSIHENYQSQNFHNEQVALNGVQEDSGDNTGEEEESGLESTNNANVAQTVENQSDTQNSEASAPAIEAFIDEPNQNIPNKDDEQDDDDDEILYSDPFEHLPYYHGEISREEAEAKLKGMLKGSFLTRCQSLYMSVLYFTS